MRMLRCARGSAPPPPFPPFDFLHAPRPYAPTAVFPDLPTHNFVRKDFDFELRHFAMDLSKTATNISGAVRVRGAGAHPGAGARSALNLAIFTMAAQAAASQAAVAHASLAAAAGGGGPRRRSKTGGQGARRFSHATGSEHPSKGCSGNDRHDPLSCCSVFLRFEERVPNRCPQGASNVCARAGKPGRRGGPAAASPSRLRRERYAKSGLRLDGAVALGGLHKVRLRPEQAAHLRLRIAKTAAICDCGPSATTP